MSNEDQLVQPAEVPPKSEESQRRETEDQLKQSTNEEAPKNEGPQEEERTMIHGVFLPLKYEKFAQAIEDFEVRDDDTWVCSFPKSGTTWTQEMVWYILNDMDFEKGKTTLAERFPFLELSILIPDRGSTDEAPKHAANSVEYTKNLPSPRFIKCHLPFHLLPRQIRSGEKQPKIIYVARNPKDACISFFHHYKLFSQYNGDLNTFFRLFLDDKVVFAPYWDHVLEFWKRRTMPNILFLKYEDLKFDLSKEIDKVTAFLEKDLDEEEKKQLIQHLSFENMKQNKSVNFASVFSQMNVKGEFIRSGKVKQWKQVMPEKIIKEFDKLTKEKLYSQNLLF